VLVGEEHWCSSSPCGALQRVVRHQRTDRPHDMMTRGCNSSPLR
jgi:hypothetical protein